jgi:Zn-dependent membrane protease YugP
MILYWEYYLMGIILIPGIILSIYAQFKVNSNFKKYGEIFSENGRTSTEVVRTFLDTAGLHDVKIVKTIK